MNHNVKICISYVLNEFFAFFLGRLVQHINRGEGDGNGEVKNLTKEEAFFETIFPIFSAHFYPFIRNIENE